MTTKKSEISVSVLDRVIFLQKRGESYKKIGNELNVSFTTVQCIVKKYEVMKTTQNKPHACHITG